MYTSPAQYIHSMYVCKSFKTYVHLIHTIPCSRRVGTYKNLNNFRQEHGMGTELVPSTPFVEVAKSLVLSNVIGHGKVPYQKPRLKSMVQYVHIYQRIVSAKVYGANPYTFV